MPQISIITVNYNDATGLERTIKSVQVQTATDYEHIIIDGNSTDGSKEIILQHQAGFSYWVSEPDNGIYNAMNKGILKAKGKYLLFLNSGDVLHSKEVLKYALDHLKNDFSFVSGNTQMLSQSPWIKKSPIRMYHSYLYHTSLPHPSTFIKSDMFVKYGVYETNYNVVADWVFFFKAIVLNAESYAYIDKIIANFNMNGISSTYDSKKERMKHLLSVHPYIKNNKNDEFLLSQFIEPNNRFKIIANLENKPLARKIATGCLTIIDKLF
ncbi:MAG: glycosyltransferase family 2 protein [Nonlabens sp.]|uniref:glycosyltransferase family 2 protein n=1 Tax=Nonlabens sp. TaxID=1888209 RepID=UPI00321B6D2F